MLQVSLPLPSTQEEKLRIEAMTAKRTDPTISHVLRRTLNVVIVAKRGT